MLGFIMFEARTLDVGFRCLNPTYVVQVLLDEIRWVAQAFVRANCYTPEVAMARSEVDVGWILDN